jgi:hypothetical protein
MGGGVWKSQQYRNNPIAHLEEATTHRIIAKTHGESHERMEHMTTMLATTSQNARSTDPEWSMLIATPPTTMT